MFYAFFPCFKITKIEADIHQVSEIDWFFFSLSVHCPSKVVRMQG